MRINLEKQKYEVEYDIKVSGYYENLDVEILEGIVDLSQQAIRLILSSSAPIETTINGKNLSINFKVNAGYTLKPFMRNGNSQAKLELNKLKNCQFISIDIENAELDDSNIDAIKELIIEELKKSSDIEVDYLLSKGPFDKLN